MSLLARFSFLILFASLMGFAVVRQMYLTQLSQPIELESDTYILEVAKGDTFNSVIGDLKEKSWLEYDWVAKFYIKHNQLGNLLKAGEFQITHGMSLEDVLNRLTTNQTVQYQVQFIEGQSYKSALDALQAHPKIKVTLHDKTPEEILALLKVPSDITHLEGQFYPDTYNFHKGDTDLEILKRAHARLQKILSQEWEARAKHSPLKSAYEALILASIIEKETGVVEERSEISGVFTRRLKKGMRLQTDPTVIYGLGDRYKGNITRKHLREYTPYNTYRIKGLPPTPIAMVGQAAIHAALHPKSGETLYFVAKGDGTHYFSKTNEEHNRAVRKYQLKRRADYRSTQ